jgi:Ca-activated chloride channel family protein
MIRPSVVVILSLSMQPISAFAVSPSTIEKNNEGILKYDKEDYYGSYQSFLETLSDEPFHPLIHLNLGMTYFQNEEADKSVMSFLAALKLARQRDNKDHLYYSLFNLAAALSSANEIDRALALYQEALTIRPGDKDVRENIEKIWQAQQGGGKGKNEDKDKKPQDKDQQDGSGNQDDQQQEPDQGESRQQKKPKPFESKELSKDDVRKILEEIKNQEQKDSCRHLRR